MAHLLYSTPLLFSPGDRMDRDEFLSRWNRMPDLKIVELIDGIVYMPSPASFEHMNHDGDVHVLLAHYVIQVGTCKLYSQRHVANAGECSAAGRRPCTASAARG